MRIPTLQKAQDYLSEGEKLNPGPWVAHSIYVGKAAKAIANHHPDLQSETAFVLGCLHDIGRREGNTNMRHSIDGFHFLADAGYHDAARICLTHSFPVQNINAIFGEWDCTPDELQFAETYLSRIHYTDYDRLVQLCDGLALPSGFCLIEKRMVDVALRHGTNEHTVSKWQALLGIKEHFENAIGQSLYALLPGVVENTFGFSDSQQ
jgi:hypothetical protein|tara:strand:+ start:813 stop:1433 length:621 start_codon:yes stop_codon:yes gene_type:complete